MIGFIEAFRTCALVMWLDSSLVMWLAVNTNCSHLEPFSTMTNICHSSVFFCIALGIIAFAWTLAVLSLPWVASGDLVIRIGCCGKSLFEGEKDFRVLFYFSLICLSWPGSMVFLLCFPFDHSGKRLIKSLAFVTYLSRMSLDHQAIGDFLQRGWEKLEMPSTQGID